MERIHRIMLASVHIFQPEEWEWLTNQFSSIDEMLRAPTLLSGLESRIQRFSSLDRATMEQELNRIMNRKDISILLWGDDEYPALLKEIPDPPLALFVKGRHQVLNEPQLKIGVVGSRKNTAYGSYAVQKIVTPLARQGVAIVSGLAYGIDALAHKQAIEEKSTTVGVLGGGVDHIYPMAHKDLYRRVSEEGCLVSEYLPSTRPLPRYFPCRNRIISGLSHGVLVIEATAKSGSLITAQCALSQNREVFAIPGSIQSIYSEGTHRLIQLGAKLVTAHTDIINEFPWIQTHFDFQSSASLTDLETSEQIVVSAIREGTGHFDALLEHTGLQAGQLNEILTMLTLRGIVSQNETEYRLLRG